MPADLRVELDGRIAGGDQRVAVGAELEPEQPRRRQHDQDGERDDHPPGVVDRIERQPVEAEGGAEQLADPTEER